MGWSKLWVSDWKIASVISSGFCIAFKSCSEFKVNKIESLRELWFARRVVHASSFLFTYKTRVVISGLHTSTSCHTSGASNDFQSCAVVALPSHVFCERSSTSNLTEAPLSQTGTYCVCQFDPSAELHLKEIWRPAMGWVEVRRLEL